MLRVPLIVLAQILGDLAARTPIPVRIRPRHRKASRPWFRVGTDIVDRHFVFQRVVVGTRELFSEMEESRMRKAAAVKPESLIVARRLDNQSIPFPVTRRITEVGGKQIRVIHVRQRTPVRVDDAPAPRSAAEDDEDPLVFGLLDELEPIGRLKLPRSAGRKAEHMRIGSPAFFLSNIEESFGPGLERNLIDAKIATASPIDGAAAAPKSLSSRRRTKDHTAGCIARSRKRGGSIRTPCSAASGATSRGRPLARNIWGLGRSLRMGKSRWQRAQHQGHQ